jgi:hypothetical protein
MHPSFKKRHSEARTMNRAREYMVVRRVVIGWKDDSGRGRVEDGLCIHAYGMNGGPYQLLFEILS